MIRVSGCPLKFFATLASANPGLGEDSGLPQLTHEWLI